MAPSPFTGLFPPTSTPHTDKIDIVTYMLKDLFTLPTLLLLGALIQLLLLSILPYRIALLPSGLLALYTILTTTTSTFLPSSNTYMSSIIPGRTSAQFPLPDSTYSSTPASTGFVVFHFGVRLNHPLGWLGPGGLTTSQHFQKCNDLLIAKATQYGMICFSPWRAGERGSNNTLMMVYYFRDMEGLNKFAHDPIHKEAWDYLRKAGPPHIGFFHEAFAVPAGQWESVYVNMPPVLLGQMNVKCDTEQGERWVRGIVDADTPALRSQWGRMGKAVQDS